MKHVVSVSLGSSKRDFSETLTLLRQEVTVKRLGTDGNVKRAAALIRELEAGTNGPVDALGLGGLDLYFYVGDRRYTLRQAARLAAQAKTTPVVCGAGLKGSLERRVVKELNCRVPLAGKRVLMVSAVDRFGMAEALTQTGASVAFGDLAFALGIPRLVYGVRQLQILARTLLPVITKLPINLLYPTGDAQNQGKTLSPFYRKVYGEAEVIAGDWHFIRRYLPEQLTGKTILTNTTTQDDADLLQRRGAKLLVTTTPRLGGRSVATNVLEAAFVAVTGGRRLSPPELAGYVAESGLSGTFLDLQVARVQGEAIDAGVKLP